MKITNLLEEAFYELSEEIVKAANGTTVQVHSVQGAYMTTVVSDLAEVQVCVNRSVIEIRNNNRKLELHPEKTNDKLRWKLHGRQVINFGSSGDLAMALIANTMPWS